MRRLQDARCKCTQKWVCSQCNTQIKIEDAVLMDEITDLLNALICNPDMLHSHQYCQKEPPVEQRRLDNEIARTLEGYDFDKDALREKLFQRADLCYQQIGNEAYIENQLRCTLEQTESLESFDAELTNKIVKQIRLSEGWNENRARTLLQQVRAHRASDLRRMRNAIPQMHMGSQWKEKGCMEMHQPP